MEHFTRYIRVWVYVNACHIWYVLYVYIRYKKVKKCFTDQNVLKTVNTKIQSHYFVSFKLALCSLTALSSKTITNQVVVPL